MLPLRRRRSGVAVLVPILIGPVAFLSAQTTPALPDILTSAAGYVVQYSTKLQALTADEVYLQMDESGGRIQSVRRLNGDAVMIGLGDGVTYMFRDTYAIDTKPFHARSDRLLKLFTDPPPPPRRGLQEAVEISESGLSYYLTRSLHTEDSPLQPLDLLRAKNQARLKYALDGVKTSAGVALATLKFSGDDASSILMTPPGIPVTGKLTVEVGTGALRQSEVVVSNKAMTLRTTVEFTFDKALGLWVPKELVQRWEISSSAAGMGELYDHGSYETHATYSNYKQVAIDPDKIR